MSGVTLRGVCAASLFFSLALCLLPEGREKRIASLCATAGLVLMLLNLVKATNWDDYALSLAELRRSADTISSAADAQSRSMNRLVIERECEEYIKDKAGELALPVKSVTVAAVWNDAGVWVPHSVVITLAEDGAGRGRLASLLEAQLGIVEARQEWRIENGT